MKYRKLLYMKLNVMVAMYCFLCRNIGSHSQYIEQHCLEYNPETLAYLRAKFYTQQQSLVNLSQIFGETPRVHVVYQHCNGTFSTIISSHVKRKHKVIKTDTQIIFTQWGYAYAGEGMLMQVWVCLCRWGYGYAGEGMLMQARFRVWGKIHFRKQQLSFFLSFLKLFFWAQQNLVKHKNWSGPAHDFPNSVATDL